MPRSKSSALNGRAARPDAPNPRSRTKGRPTAAKYSELWRGMTEGKLSPEDTKEALIIFNDLIEAEVRKGKTVRLRSRVARITFEPLQP